MTDSVLDVHAMTPAAAARVVLEAVLADDIAAGSVMTHEAASRPEMLLDMVTAWCDMAIARAVDFDQVTHPPGARFYPDAALSACRHSDVEDAWARNLIAARAAGDTAAYDALLSACPADWRLHIWSLLACTVESIKGMSYDDVINGR